MASQSTRTASSKRARTEEGVASTPRRAPSCRGVVSDTTSTFGSAIFKVITPNKSSKVNVPASASSSATAPFTDDKDTDSARAPEARPGRLAVRTEARRSPKNNRERLYGLLPQPCDDNYETILEKRTKAARLRRLHSVFNEATGGTRRAIPCARCAYHLADWEGPDEGPRPLCIDGTSSNCNRCASASVGKPCVEVSGVPRSKVLTLEEVAQKTVDDAGLPALHAAQKATKKALTQAMKMTRKPTVDEAKVAQEKRERNAERRIVAAEQQAKATMELAKSNMEIVKTIDRHGAIVGRSALILQPVGNADLSPDALDDIQGMDCV